MVFDASDWLDLDADEDEECGECASGALHACDSDVASDIAADRRELANEGRQER